MSTPYEDALSAIVGGSDTSGTSDALANIASGDFTSSPSPGSSPKQDDWWNQYWGHLSDQATSAYHASSNGEESAMPTTDPMTLSQLIGNRAPYLTEIDSASDPNADADTKTRAATAAQRLARIDSVLSMMHGQGPAEPMTTQRADDVVNSLTHSQLMASDRYRQVYDSTSTDFMDEQKRRDYARDVIAKEVSDLPYQRESILAQIAGQDPDKALEMYGIKPPGADQAKFYKEHDADVPLPSSLQPAVTQTGPEQNPLDELASMERVGLAHTEASAAGVAAATNVLIGMPAAALYDGLASEFGGDPNAAKDWVGKNLVDPASDEAKELRAGSIPKGVAERALGMAGDMAGPFVTMLLTRNPELATLAAPADLSVLEQVSANVTAQLPGATAMALPTTTEEAMARAQEGDVPSTAEFLGSLGENTALSSAPMAAGGSLPAKIAQGGAAQTAIALGQGETDPGALAASFIVGGGMGAAHVSPHAEVQTPADVGAAREGYQSAAQAQDVAGARAKWEDRFAKVAEKMGDDPEAKARADWALSQFNDGSKTGLWAMQELNHIAKTGETRDEDAYNATSASESDVGQTLGETPASVESEVQSERQAGEEVFGEPTAEAPLNESPIAEPEQVSEADLTPAERESFARQQETQQLHENNASGESAASIEAQNRARDEAAAGQHRVLIDRDGTVIPLHGVDAVDTHARAGQVVAQRGIGADPEGWTILSHGDDVPKLVAAGRVNAAKPQLDEIVNEAKNGRAGGGGETVATGGADQGAGVSQNETARARLGTPLAGEESTAGVGAPVDVDSAANAAETSPLTEGQPSEAKIAAGNYKKGHIKAQGMDITVENPRGSTRSGIGPDGRSWSRTMNHHYGYIRGTLGADGGHLDVLLGDQPNNNGRQVFVVDQLKPDGSFDEHKVLMGFRNQREATKAYLSEYPKGWQGMGRVRAMSGPEFKTWTQGRGRDEASTGPVSDNVPHITLRHQQADATTVHASAPVEGTTVPASPNGFDGQPLARLALPNASMPSRRRAVLSEVPRGGPVPEGHASAVLRNVYDLGRDPRGLMQKARAEVETRNMPLDENHVINEFERQVVANGFDGYKSEGHVTVLGHDVPVARSEETPHEVRPNAQPEQAGEGEGVPHAVAGGTGDAGGPSESNVSDQGAGTDVPSETGADQRASAPAPKVKTPKYAGPGMSKSSVHGLLKLLKWDAAKRGIVVHQTEAELPSHLRDNTPDDYRGRVHGLYDPTTGKVHVIADKMTSPKELYRTLTEEHLGHGGLRKIFNEHDLNEFLDRSWKSIPKPDREKIAEQYGTTGKPLNMTLPENRRLVAEEYLAKLDPAAVRNRSLFDKFHSWFNDTSRKMGREVDYSHAELRSVMQVAHDHQRAGLSPSHGSKSPIDNITPRFNLDGTSRVSDETFYSALVRSLENGKGMPKAGDAKVWKEWLDGAQRRGEFKQAEREWMGLDHYLDSRNNVATDDTQPGLFASAPPRKITREDVVSYARQHQVEVHDNFLHGESVSEEDVEAAYEEYRRLQEQYGNEDSDVEDAYSHWEDLRDQYDSRDEEGGTKYGTYTLPGGWNYKELLLTLTEHDPEADAADEEYDRREAEANDSASNYSVATIRRHGPTLRDIVIHRTDASGSVHSGTFPVATRERFGGTDEEAIADHLGEPRNAPPSTKPYEPPKQETFQSGHFDQPNIVAHTRMKDRVGADGKRVLHLEEIQSDWHQEGRKRGYKSAAATTHYKAQLDEINRRMGKIADSPLSADREEWQNLNRKRNELERAMVRGGVADAPFKTSWPMLAFKRALRYAAENGHDRISWTTGNQQAKRYNLGDHVHMINVQPGGAGRSVEAYTRSGYNLSLLVDGDGKITQASNDTLRNHNLSDVVGAELAKRIMSAEKETNIPSSELTVGGEGMKAFYDKMLPTEIGRYVKQWGGKVEDAAVTDLGGHNEFPGAVDDSSKIAAHSVDITPEMRKSVLAGQPMFRIGRVKADADTEAAMARTMAKSPEDMTLGDRARRWLDDLKSSSLRNGWESFKQGMLDSGNQIARIEREIFGGFLGDAAESPYKMYNLSKNSHAVMAAVMKLGAPEYRDGSFQPVDGRKGLFEIFRPLFEHESGDSLLPLWEFYAAGKRASRLINETNVNGTLREKNFTQDDIDKALALEQKYPVFKRVADDFQQFNNDLLDLAAGRGAIDADEAAAWKANFYVPFYRAMEDMEFGGTSKVAKTRRGSAASNQKIFSRRLTGQEAKVDNVFENILGNVSYILDRTYRQEFMNRLLDMGEGSVLERVPMANKAISVSVGDLARALSNLGYSAGSATHGAFGSPHIQPSKHWSTVEVDALTPSQKAEWTRVFQRVAPTDPDIVPIMRDGKMQYYRVTDPLLLRTIGAMGHDSFGKVISFLGGGKRLMTWGITKDPGFMAATWFRDALINWVGSHTPITPFVDNAKGALESIRQDPIVSQLMMAGVGVAPHYDTQGSTVRSQLERRYGKTTMLGTLRNFADFYNRIGIAAEASSRVAIAHSVLSRGGSVAEAAYQAQDILNYSMRGDYVAARVLAQTAPFWNAGMQGLYRFLRGAGVANAKAGDTSQLRSYMLRGSALVAASLGNMWRNQDDPRYQRLTNDEKDRYWHFFIGDQHFKLPKPFEAGVIFGTIPERIVQRVLGNDTMKDSMRAALTSLTEEMRLDPFPQYFRQGVEQWANRDTSTGNPIVPGSMMEDLPADQYSPYTHLSAIWIAHAMPESMPWLNSPKRVDSLVRGITGTMGVYALDAADWLARASGYAPAAPTARLQDTRVIGRFYGGDSQTGDRSQYEDKLYELKDTADQTFHSFQKATEDANVPRMQELTKRPAFQYQASLDTMARDVSVLRGVERQIMQNPFIGPDDKRKQLDDVSAARVKLLDQYGPLLDKLHDQF